MGGKGCTTKNLTIICLAASLSIPSGTAALAQTVWTKYVGNSVFDVGPAGNRREGIFIDVDVMPKTL